MAGGGGGGGGGGDGGGRGAGVVGAGVPPGAGAAVDGARGARPARHAAPRVALPLRLRRLPPPPPRRRRRPPPAADDAFALRGRHAMIRLLFPSIPGTHTSE